MSFNTSWLSRLGLFVGVCLLASGLYLIDYTPTVMSQETTNLVLSGLILLVGIVFFFRSET